MMTSTVTHCKQKKEKSGQTKGHAMSYLGQVSKVGHWFLSRSLKAESHWCRCCCYCRGQTPSQEKRKSRATSTLCRVVLFVQDSIRGHAERHSRFLCEACDVLHLLNLQFILFPCSQNRTFWYLCFRENTRKSENCSEGTLVCNLHQGNSSFSQQIHLSGIHRKKTETQCLQPLPLWAPKPQFWFAW